MPDSYWSCVQCYPSQEHVALAHIRSHTFSAFFPYFISRDKSRHRSLRPMFPGYIFIKLNDTQNWRAINRLHGVIRVLTACGTDNPCHVPADFISLVERVVMASRPYVIPKGSQVEILDGIFKDKRGIVVASSAARIAVLLSVLGRDLSFQFEPKDVKVRNESDIDNAP